MVARGRRIGACAARWAQPARSHGAPRGRVPASWPRICLPPVTSAIWIATRTPATRTPCARTTPRSTPWCRASWCRASDHEFLIVAHGMRAARRRSAARRLLPGGDHARRITGRSGGSSHDRGRRRTGPAHRRHVVGLRALRLRPAIGFAAHRRPWRAAWASALVVARPPSLTLTLGAPVPGPAFVAGDAALWLALGAARLAGVHARHPKPQPTRPRARVLGPADWLARAAFVVVARRPSPCPSSSTWRRRTGNGTRGPSGTRRPGSCFARATAGRRRWRIFWSAAESSDVGVAERGAPVGLCGRGAHRRAGAALGRLRSHCARGRRGRAERGPHARPGWPVRCWWRRSRSRIWWPRRPPTCRSMLFVTLAGDAAAGRPAGVAESAAGALGAAAGRSAGSLAAWTKNEGAVFLAASALLVAWIALRHGHARDMVWWVAGAAPVLAVVVWFKLVLTAGASPVYGPSTTAVRSWLPGVARPARAHHRADVAALS